MKRIVSVSLLCFTLAVLGACAVSAQERHELAFLHLKTYVIQCKLTILELLRNMVDLNNKIRFCHFFPYKHAHTRAKYGAKVLQIIELRKFFCFFYDICKLLRAERRTITAVIAESVSLMGMDHHTPSKGSMNAIGSSKVSGIR